MSTAVALDRKNPMQDWIRVPDENLCQGHYIAPTFIPPHAADTMELSADRSEITLDGHSSMYGNVVMMQGDRRIEADEAHIVLTPATRDIKSITLHGNVHYLQPGLQIYSTSAWSDRAAQQISIDSALYHLYTRHARGEAAKITVDPKNHAVLNKASYTTCAPGHNAWSLYAQTVTFDPIGGWGSAHHARIYVHDIPVFYVPYLNFPLDKRRKTGFLYPSIGHATESGTIYEFPIYFNLAPNYDLLISADRLTARGNRLSGYLRYLTPKSHGSVGLSVLPDDKAYRAFRYNTRRHHPLVSDLQDPRLTGLSGLHRAEFHIDHVSQWHPNWTASINYHIVSDDNYFMDFSPGYGAGTTDLLQEAKLVHKTAHWIQMLRFQEYQVLHPYNGPLQNEVYRRQPQFLFSGNYPNIWAHLGTSVSGEFVDFRQRNDPTTGNTPTEGQRYHLRPSLRLPWEETAWHIIPRIQWDITQYYLTRGTLDKQAGLAHQLTRMIPLYDLHTGLVFDRTFQWRGTPAIQTLEPELYYLYVPYQAQVAYPVFDSGPINFDRARMFYDNRFSGIDRIGDAHQITFGLSSQFLRRSDQKERFNLRIAQTLQFHDQQVTICDTKTDKTCALRENPYATDRWSPLMGEARWALNDTWTAIGSLGWQYTPQALTQSALTFQYRGPADSALNIGHQYMQVDPSRADAQPARIIPLRQSDISFYLPMTPRWRLLSRWHYDHADRRTMDTLAGIEYDSCCFALQLTTARVLRPRTEESLNLPSDITGRRYDQRVYLNIMLKGLSTFGYHQNDNQVTKLIPGYRAFTLRDLNPSAS